MFRILGPLEIERDGRLVEVVGQRQRALLITLLLHANEVVSTDRLVDDLWHGSPPRTATTSLHNAVSQLRRELGDMIVTHPPGYVLRVARTDVDAYLFEDLVLGARGREATDRVAALEEALSLWRGAALLDVAYEPFAQGAVNRLEELRLVAREDLVDAELDLGRHEQLVAELESRVSEHPLRERLWGQLMMALYRCGRQGDASQAYQKARRTLVEELGIEPGPALKQLHGAIIRQEVDVPGSDRRRSGPGAGELAEVAGAVLAGRVVAVLGEDTEGLAERLAQRFRYPPGEPAEVPRVSEYAAATSGYGPLYDEIGELVRGGSPQGAVHEFFASLPPLLRARGVPHQLLVTTSYGSALERAFAAAGEEVDVVSYLASGPDRGKFSHLAPDGSSRIIAVPNTYAEELSLDRRTVILKIRGQADPTASGLHDSFVVTEDDYIAYLRRTDVAASVPVGLAAALRRSHFLFLGYTVRDWHLRLVLGRMWGDEPVAYRSWAVHPTPGPAERELWRRLDVELTETPLEAYVQELAAALGLPAEVAA